MTWLSLTSLPQQHHLGELAPCPEHEAHGKRQLPVLQCGVIEAPRQEAHEQFLKQGRRKRLLFYWQLPVATSDTLNEGVHRGTVTGV